MAPNDDYSRDRDKVLDQIKSTPPVDYGVYRTWMNPLNKLKWRKVIIKRMTTCTLDDGRKFTLDYDKQPGLVLIKPTTGFFPMGWINIKKVEREDGEWIVE
jgi:hypothetical protein